MPSRFPSSADGSGGRILRQREHLVDGGEIISGRGPGGGRFGIGANLRRRRGLNEPTAEALSPEEEKRLAEILKQ